MSSESNNIYKSIENTIRPLLHALQEVPPLQVSVLSIPRELLRVHLVAIESVQEAHFVFLRHRRLGSLQSRDIRRSLQFGVHIRASVDKGFRGTWLTGARRSDERHESTV